MCAVIENGGVEIATLAIRRASSPSEGNILNGMPESITLLPNTSDARNTEKAARIARLAKELGYAAVMANTAVATARDIHAIARTFRVAIEAGRLTYLSGPGRIMEGGTEVSSLLTEFLKER